jgi:hypothetical protein
VVVGCLVTGVIERVAELVREDALGDRLDQLVERLAPQMAGNVVKRVAGGQLPRQFHRLTDSDDHQSGNVDACSVAGPGDRRQPRRAAEVGHHVEHAPIG